LISAGAPPHTLLGKLTASQTLWLDLRGLTSKGREGRKDGREGQGRRKRVGKERTMLALQLINHLCR